MLEFGTHESVPFPTPVEHPKVDLKHAHVESDGDDDEAQGPSGKVSCPCARGDAHVPEQAPELPEDGKADGRDREEADPFARDDGAEAESGQEEVRPPCSGECSLAAAAGTTGTGGGGAVEGGETDEKVGGEGGKEYQRGIEQNESGLGDEAVFERDEERGEGGAGDAGAEPLAEGEVREGNGGDPEERGQESHGDVGYVRFEVVPL